MLNLEVTSEELEILRDVLQNELKKIDVEVSRTDTHDFKELLKNRRAILEHVFDKVSAAPVN